MTHQWQARYLTAFSGSQSELKNSLDSLLADLQAHDQDLRLNPLNGQEELEALVSSDFEFFLKVHWNPAPLPSILVVFDVTMLTQVEPSRFDEMLLKVAKTHLPELTLVYNSFGRERTISLFPRLLDFENVVRELIVTVMLEHFGANWWIAIMGNKELQTHGRKADYNRQQERDGKLHDFHLMHPVYYLDLKDLRKIMEQADVLIEAQEGAKLPAPKTEEIKVRRKREQDLSARLPFTSILENYDEVSIVSKISEIRELRNRVMHGRYLTNSNEQLVRLICGQYYRFLVEPGHVGDFEDRVLADR